MPKIYFCSNVGGGVFGGQQVNAWRAMGLNAQLHSSIGLEDYWRGKSSLLFRPKLRALMYLHYPFALRSAVRNAKLGDLFISVTNPFFAPAIAAHSAQRSGANVVHLVYDLYPDALIYGAGWPENGVLSRLAARATSYAIRNCAATVYLGERLRQYAEHKYGASPLTKVIPVGTDTSLFKNCEPVPRHGKDVLCLYSGHMGRLHDWRTLAACVERGLPTDLSIEIAADGPGLRYLKQYLASDKPAGFVFSSTRTSERWKSMMTTTDVAIVTMVPGAEKVVMPSKTYSAMAAGQAVLAICPKDSDLADLVRNNDCGWLVEPGDIANLGSLLSRFPSMKDEILAKRRNAYKAAHSIYSIEATSRMWLDLFNKLNDER